MSEKELGQKWDRCLADCAVKVGAGIGLGIVFSVVFFKRRTMPIAFGTGIGLGMAYSNCQNDLRSQYLLHSSVTKHFWTWLGDVTQMNETFHDRIKQLEIMR